MKKQLILLPRQPQPSFGLGAIAGGSVPSTATAAGYFYIISSAGTSQSVTWAVGDWAVYNGVSGSWTKVPFASTVDITAYANLVNPRAAQGGLFFDGTPNSRVYAPLTGQALGTESFSLVAKVYIPVGNPSGGRTIVALSSSNTNSNVANAFTLDVTSAGALGVALYGASGADFRVHWFSTFVATYGGTTVLLEVVRNAVAGTVTLKINGLAQTPTSSTTAGTAPAWTGTVTNTNVLWGVTTSGQEYTGLIIYSTTVYNLALTSTDSTEITQRGGGVPERYEWASMSDVITSSQDRDFSAAGTGNWTVLFGTGAAVSNPSNALEITGTTGSCGVRISGGNWRSTPNARSFRVRFTHTNVSGTPVVWRFSPSGELNEATTEFTPSGTPTSVDVIAYWRSGGATLGNPTIYAPGCNGSVLRMDNLSIVPAGAIAHFDADLDGIGFQLHEQSANKLDGIVTTSGVIWTKPASSGYVRGTLTWAATHEGKSLLGQQCFPTGVVVQLLTLKSTASTSGSGTAVGTTNSSTRWRAAAALTTNTKAVAALANQLPGGTAAGDLDLVVDPDTANFTGSIAVEARYAQTEGT